MPGVRAFRYVLTQLQLSRSRGRLSWRLRHNRLPSWATDRDRENTLNAIAAEGIKETAEMKQR
jgi:hypothetical protein